MDAKNSQILRLFLVTQTDGFYWVIGVIDHIMLHDFEQVAQGKGLCQECVGAEFFGPVVVVAVTGCGNEAGLGTLLFNGLQGIEFIGIGHFGQQEVDMMPLCKKCGHFAGGFERQHFAIDAVGHHIADEIPLMRFVVDHGYLHVVDDSGLQIIVRCDILNRLMLRSTLIFSQADPKG